MVAAHRAPRARSFLRRHALALASALTVVVAVVSGLAIGGVFPFGRHSAPKVAVAAALPWRTQWALSLDYAGDLPGSQLTCRLVTRVNLSGTQVRFRLVNYPSTTPVTFTRLVAAIRTSGLAVDPSTQREVTVGGAKSVTLPVNGQVLTDPVDLAVKRGQDLTLSVAVGAGVSAPWHFWSAQNSGCSSPGAGDTAAERDGISFENVSQDRWLSEVQVLATHPVPTVAVYGDSLTGGVFLPTDVGARWTDQVQADSEGRLIVLNYGIVGDRITGEAPPGQLPARFAEDVLAPPGLTAVLVEMGSNDIKAGVSAKEILAQYQLAATAVARRHLTLIVATVPGRSDNLSAAAEHQRQLLNEGLRAYPIVADMDAALTDDATGRLQSRYDVGDHVHPNVAGVAVITGVMRAAIGQVPGALGAAAR